MRLVRTEILLAKGSFALSSEWQQCQKEIEAAIRAVVWPHGSSRFAICPNRGRGRGEGNGVVPIKEAFVGSLGEAGWRTNERANPLRFDAFKELPGGKGFGIEWETGNISSSHRSVNRILRGHLEGVLIGGALVLPTRDLYQYLTDRVGNYEELEPYFPVWRVYPWEEGVLGVFAVEHDAVDSSVPRIGKGTNGRALG